RIVLERILGTLGRCAVGGTALAQRLDRGVEGLRRDAGARQNAASLAVLLEREREQQSLDRDIAVARLLGDLLGLVEDARERRVEIDLTGPAARNLGPLGERRLDRAQSFPRAPAGAVDQT